MAEVRQNHPFEVAAWVWLPDHLHCLWTLPESDRDYSIRWSLIKGGDSRRCGEVYRQGGKPSLSRIKGGESNLWQRRFWEHQIRDEQDLVAHTDYLHYNPGQTRLCATGKGLALFDLPALPEGWVVWSPLGGWGGVGGRAWGWI